MFLVDFLQTSYCGQIMNYMIVFVLEIKNGGHGLHFRDKECGRLV